MNTDKTYRGQITRITVDENRVLGLKYEGSNDVVAFYELFAENLLLYGNYIVIDYVLRQAPFRAESLMKHDFFRVSGYAEVLSPHVFKIANYDFMNVLESYLGWFIHLNTTYNHAP